MYELMGRIHARLMQQQGQGTVEYVGLILLLGVILAGVVAAAGGLTDTGIAETVVKKLKGRSTRWATSRSPVRPCQTGRVPAPDSIQRGIR